MAYFSQRIDSRVAAGNRPRIPQNRRRPLGCRSKVLNPRTESKCEGSVASRTFDKNKFTNRLRLKVAMARFPTALPRYADK
ncbi:hypothetical protein [Rhodopseudomonas sp. P2A-2r]|uniref:hypothetical protein n=1 Tax=unclassified Rhodopseudomonas TaxID=2638247 RepID=UPI0022349325|nr:hypothetical protein [Rhodopseudomonas sp. P2A-2r]UZE49303.1 hypothetical protein ONR75_32340 [Rhodopseudomonas sp. P2A-2r]